MDESRNQLRIAQNSIAKPGKSPGDVHGHTTRALELIPQLVGLIELEVREPCVIRDLPRRDGNGMHRHPGKPQSHQIANFLGRTDLELRREAAAQIFGRQRRRAPPG